MANTVLLFKDEHLDFFALKLDEVTFKKPPIDLVDRPVYRFALGMLNKVVSKEIPDEYKVEFQEAVDLVVLGDYDDAGAEAIDVLVQLVENWEKLGAGAREIVLGLLAIAKGTLEALD